YNDFPYDDKDCDKQPNGQLISEASDFKMLGFNRLTTTESTNGINLHAIKEHLAKDVPVVIGMMVGGSFMHEMAGKDIWHPTDDDYNMMGFGGHALCVIGYNDRKEGGAFEIMNSWGKDWGNNGVAYVKYNDFKRFVREAYGINPMPKKGAADVQNLACSIGLVDAKTKNYIPLQLSSDNIFQTTQPIAKGTTFKMEVKNTSACYVYVLGKETDGSSYVLFPYPSKSDATKTKFSPYCGITGYRLFPRGMSMQADEIGNKDYIAVVTSKEPLNVFELNDAVNANKTKGFETAVNNAIKRLTVKGVQFNSNQNGTINFETAIGDKNTVACIVAIDKQ
ncbi:MAG: peptidase C1A papain, partial [Pedobacter sp.]|nr:peptidase C1A papain [Chitinophagaceae bacterium]